MNSLDGTGLWDETDQFYYDHLHLDGQYVPLKVRSLVGLLPLITVEVFDGELINQFPDFRRKLDWFIKYRHDLVKHINFAQCEDGKLKMLLSVPSKEILQRVVTVLLDESEFLSTYGIRSLSKIHEQQPFELTIRGNHHSVSYVPGESDSWMFGGNSNWRGPIWFPINYLLIESLQHYHEFYGDSFQVECPTGSGKWMNLEQASKEITSRLLKIFRKPESEASRPGMKRGVFSQTDPLWQDNILFHEYFHGDTGEGLGACHQTGWTALVANCIEMLHENPSTAGSS